MNNCKICKGKANCNFCGNRMTKLVVTIKKVVNSEELAALATKAEERGFGFMKKVNDKEVKPTEKEVVQRYIERCGTEALDND